MSKKLEEAIAERELAKRPKPIPQAKKPKAPPASLAFQPPPS